MKALIVGVAALVGVFGGSVTADAQGFDRYPDRIFCKAIAIELNQAGKPDSSTMHMYGCDDTNGNGIYHPTKGRCEAVARMYGKQGLRGERHPRAVEQHKCRILEDGTWISTR